MRAKLVLLAVALLLGGGSSTSASRMADAELIEAGKAAPGRRVAAASDETPPLATPTGRALPSDDKASGVARVGVTPVRKSEVPIYLSGIGTVQAYYKVDVTSQVDGVITKMPFQEGQDVKIGDTLVEIDPTIYQARLDLAKAQRDRAAVQLENSKTNLWRDEELLKHDFASQKQTDQERMLVGQYSAEVAQYEAEMKYAQARLDYATIKSPINGRISIRSVDPGNLVRAGQETILATVVQLKPISVLITVSAKELERHGASLGITSLPVFAYAENENHPARPRRSSNGQRRGEPEQRDDHPESQFSQRTGKALAR